MAERAVFLDRDGTMIEDVGYLDDPEGIAIYAEAIEAVQNLREHGWKIVVVTNQSGVARGLFDEGTLERIHDQLREAFLHQGAPIDAILTCPHHPEANVLRYRRHCTCRKPQPGLLRRAAQSMEIDLARSYMIGDKLSDVEAGHRASCRSILVLTGVGQESVSALEDSKDRASRGRAALAQPDHVADNLLEASEWLLREESAPVEDH